MANCYKCAHQREIDALVGEQRRLETICRNCIIKEHGCGLSHGGVSFVSSDAAANPELVYRGRIAPDYVLPGEKRSVEVLSSPLNGSERNNLLLLLRNFAALSYDDAGLICSMLGGKTIDEVARERNISEQALHARWKKLIRDNPVWASLANGLIGKGVGRKKKEKLKQGEFDL